MLNKYYYAKSKKFKGQGEDDDCEDDDHTTQ